MADDRYQPNPLDGPAGLAEWMRGVDRKLAELAGAPAGGTFTSKDATGDSLVNLGDLSDGSRGLQIISATYGWELVKMTTEGWSAPHLMGAPGNPSDQIAVTSGTFVDTFTVTFGSALGPGVEVLVPWTTGAATTGEIQVTSNVPSDTTEQSLAAAGGGVYFVRWLHGTPPGTGPLELRIQARRTSGVNNVTIFPCQAWVQEPLLCTSGGDWI